MHYVCQLHDNQLGSFSIMTSFRQGGGSCSYKNVIYASILHMCVYFPYQGWLVHNKHNVINCTAANIDSDDLGFLVIEC